MSTILVVDDELHTREICVDFLEDYGYQVESVTNGREALESLAKKPYDVLLSDIQMPEMDGLALLKESRKLYPEMEVILMTAYGALPSAIEAIRSGAYDYLIKPTSREFLLNTIRRSLEKKDLQRRLKESQNRLIEQEKLATLGAVSAWLSHRMRNSLSVILMCAHYLKGKMGEPPLQSSTDPQTKDFREVITAIIDKIKILEKITSDFIAYSKKYDLDKTQGNVNTVLRDLSESLQSTAKTKGVRMILDLDKNVPDMACDPHMLNEAFENVFVNGLQAIGSQENQRIEIRSRFIPLQGTGDQGSIEVLIANSGSLIPPENRDKIFTPFFTTKENGSGLGLAIVKKVVEGHGGRVSAESREEKGEKVTVFKAVFPLLGTGVYP